MKKIFTSLFFFSVSLMLLFILSLDNTSPPADDMNGVALQQGVQSSYFVAEIDGSLYAPEALAVLTLTPADDMNMQVANCDMMSKTMQDAVDPHMSSGRMSAVEWLVASLDMGTTGQAQLNVHDWSYTKSPVTDPTVMLVQSIERQRKPAVTTTTVMTNTSMPMNHQFSFQGKSYMPGGALCLASVLATANFDSGQLLRSTAGLSFNNRFV